MNDLKGLGSGHPSLVDSEAVQSLQNGLNFAFSQQFPCKLLCGKSDYLEIIKAAQPRATY